MNKNMRK